MRVFPTSIAGQLNRQYGSEPVIIAEIEFIPGFSVAYADRVLNGEPGILPKILEVGNLDSTALATLQSDSQAIDLTLDDTDSSLKTLIDANDISLGKVRFSLSFQGVPFSERALLMEGVIHSPIVYNDLSKTLTITVISKTADAETGFSMDDGDFPNIPEDQRGLQWPLIFGDVCNVATLPLKPLFKGVLGEPLGAIDPTLQERLCQAQKLQCPAVISPEAQKEINELERARDAALEAFRAKYAAARKGIVHIQPSAASGQRVGFAFGNSTDEALALFFCLKRVANPNVQNTAFQPIPGCVSEGQAEINLINEYQNKINEVADRSRKIYQECVEARQSQVCAILTEIAQQTPYVKTSVQIIGGEKFPQGTVITLRIGDVRYTGVMSGTTFNIRGVTHPDSLEITNPACKNIGQRYEIRGVASPFELPTTVAGCKEKTEVAEVIVGPGASWKYFETFKAGRFIWLPSGTDVFLESSSKITHIVSLVPGVVTQVAAYRTFGDSKILTEVDPAEYEVNLTNYGDYQVAELQFDRKLSDIPDEKWDDDVYVSFESNFGPNPVNIIKYLIDTYTEYTYDVASFGSVEASLANYPASFVVRDRQSVFELIKEIAYQFRCAVTIRAGVVYLTYLSKEPTSIRSITASEILRSSFSVSTTPTEDIFTKHIISWQATEAKIYANQDVEEKFTLKHNVGRFGTNTTEKDYFTQNTFKTIEKSATFWMIRDANSWKYVEFETPIKHLDLDVYDCITVSHPGFPATKCVIESLNVNFDSNTIKFRCWTPILAGTNSPYVWAWPALLPAVGLFPGPDYKDNGDGLKKVVRPPVGHPLRQGFDLSALRLPTDGDRNPSDLDDTYPASPCAQLIATGSEFSADIEPIFRPFETQAFSNFANDLDSKSPPPVDFFVPRNPQESSGGGVGDAGGRKRKDPLDDCTIPDSTGCSFTVTVTYVLPDLIRPGCDTGPCESVDNVPGFACSATVDSACHVFSNRQAAESFRASKAAEAAAMQCKQIRNKWGLYFVSPVAQSKLSCPEQKEKNNSQVGFHSPNGNDSLIKHLTESSAKV
jgi:hypothetical protein